MTDKPIWGEIALAHSPMVEKARGATATRLTVFPLRSDAALDVAAFLETVSEVWPADGPSVSLNVLSETLLADLLRAELAGNVMLEVPSFMAGAPEHTEGIRRLHAAGTVLMVKGRPASELPPEVARCFRYSVIDVAEDMRLHGIDPPAAAGTAAAGKAQFIHSGVHSIADMETSFKRGASAVFGWPMDPAVETGAAARPASTPDLQVIMELIHRVDKEEAIEKLEETLRRDPTLAFKLLRYMNSPAFGLRVEISTFRHALMMLGYQRLKRWLALLLATAGKDGNQRPLMFAAVRRGLLMEELVRSSGDEEMRNEMFICGVFSLLDRMFRQPFAELLQTIPVPPRVFQALVEGAGPYQPYFDLVRALEGESMFDIREAADTLMLSMGEVNRAEVRALTSATKLE